MRRANHFQFVYDVNDSIEDKLNAIATKVYHADGVVIAASAKKQLKQLTELALTSSPSAWPKTQFSFSDDASKPRRAPRLQDHRPRPQGSTPVRASWSPRPATS